MRIENTKNTVANVIRGVRDRVQQGGGSNRPAGTMVDYNDLERCFDILNIHLAPALRAGKAILIYPQSTVGRNIIHLTRDDQ